MYRRNISLAVAILLAIATMLLAFRWKVQPKDQTEPAQLPAATPVVKEDAPDYALTNTPPTAQLPQKVRTRFSEFSSNDRTQFVAKFVQTYKPAVIAWSKAYKDRTPFEPEDLKPDDFREKIGRDSSYSDYIFVVDGITLGVRETPGGVSVDYLNDPRQTRLMAKLPDGQQVPVTKSPLTKGDILQMMKNDTAVQIMPEEIRMIPTGFSGSLNGGVMVEVGGDPDNIASWKFNMVFGADGKLAYYLRGDQ